MCPASVRFSYRPGLAWNPFRNVRIAGNWDASGRPAADWSFTPMHPAVDEDGCQAFEAVVRFDDSAVGEVLRWGVMLDAPLGEGLWGIASEVDDVASRARERSFKLQAGAHDEIYYLTHCGRLGALPQPGSSGIRFSLWAPNARSIDLVLADPAHGYIADDGSGVLESVPMATVPGGVWQVKFADFSQFVGEPYMFRVVKDDGTVAFRTDIYSRKQIGAGNTDPKGQPYLGSPADLDGPQSCSVVCDPGSIALHSGKEVPTDVFWADEFSVDHPLPTKLEDLVIYELHVGSLGFGKPGPGTLIDALAYVDHLVELGVNAVELMPIAEFEGNANWGYGTSHYFAIDEGAGGTDCLRQFVKACHQQGIVVILDVCYNHFDPDGDRVEWAYDSNDPTKNIYFWYEGKPSDYPQADGGYIDNLSTGYAPKFDDEMVRQLFISSAAWLVATCHVDGFRLDQTSSIHQYAVIHANGRTADRANAFGTKFLKQWTRTMRLLYPNLFLAAEDYSNWGGMTQPSVTGDGLGFDATWYGDFQHHVVEYQGGGYTELVKQSGYGDARSIRMDYFAAALASSGGAKVVYHESHDDCGNRTGSARTMCLAVNGAPLVGETRNWAEARARFAAGMTLLSAGTPMFFMGEEIGAANPYTYDGFMQNREDLIGAAKGVGARLFRYYQDLIRLSERNAAIRSRMIQIAVTDNDNRVIAFHRWNDTDEFLVVGNLSNTPFASGYWINGDRIGNVGWTEVFNSDSEAYGGRNIGNSGATLHSSNGALNVVLPAAGLVVFRRGDLNADGLAG
jgi:1,4-alpha-glucan branching enzyme